MASTDMIRSSLSCHTVRHQLSGKTRCLKIAANRSPISAARPSQLVISAKGSAPKGLGASLGEPRLRSIDMLNSDFTDKVDMVESEHTSFLPPSEVMSGRLALASTLFASSILLPAQEAMAKGGEYGILEGRTAALVHPVVLGGLFVGSLYAAWTGFQWRELRTSAAKLADLKKQVLVDAEGNKMTSPVDAEIAELTARRKELQAGGSRDKHQEMGNILLALGVTTSIAGAMNTYMRVGKLFPGPHLFAGAGITCLWAMAAALVPAMQKGNEAARNGHIALNVANIALFAWQIPTGLEIVGKVLQFTSWP